MNDDDVDFCLSLLGPPQGKTYDESADLFQVSVINLLTESGQIASIDQHALNQVVRSYRRVIEMEDILKVEGLIIDSPHGRKTNPLVASIQAEERLLNKFYAQFGMTPSSRNNKDQVKLGPLHGNSKANDGIMSLIND